MSNYPSYCQQYANMSRTRCVYERVCAISGQTRSAKNNRAPHPRVMVLAATIAITVPTTVLVCSSNHVPPLRYKYSTYLICFLHVFICYVPIQVICPLQFFICSVTLPAVQLNCFLQFFLPCPLHICKRYGSSRCSFSRCRFR